MAFVTDRTFLNIAMVDAAGNKASYNFELSYADLTALQVADLAGAIDQIITDLVAITGAQVLSYSFGEKIVEDTAQYGAAGSEVENVALINAKIDGVTGKAVLLRLPAPVDGVFLGATGPDRNIVDTGDVALQTFLAHFGTAGEVLVSDGESIADPAVAGNFKGKRIHRASTRG